VRFWDTSGLIPLLVSEAGSGRVRQWLEEDPDVVVWTLARVELLSALARAHVPVATTEDLIAMKVLA
jgi:uncharacterized protein with PIN domain